MKKNKKYYVGFKGNNAICNENFFDGSITLYPTGEKGNIYFSNQTLDDTNSKDFLIKYQSYLKEKMLNISESEFVIFNKKVFDLCKNFDNVKIIYNKNDELLNFINNKFLIRDYLKDVVNVLTYDFVSIPNNQLSIKDKMVFQEKYGSGGNNTYLIENNSQLYKLQGDYIVSKYISNTPLNITLVIGINDIIVFPVSAQLISLEDNKFKYKGGDFIYTQSLDKKIINDIKNYSIKIADKLKNEGYLGIIGIDYILTDDNIYFMEINPRFQSSSFLINLELKEKYNSSLAELHTLAIEMKSLPKINITNINYSFLNCENDVDYEEFSPYFIIKNGYKENIKGLIFRKIYDYSILKSDKFERL